MKLTFTKMHGLGNDFIVVDETRGKLRGLNLKKQARPLCNRRLGIGADQILVLGRSRKADFKMTIYNADGREAEMCGNGLRAIARYARDAGLTKRSEITVETKAGVQSVKSVARNRYRVDMGVPVLIGRRIPVTLAGRVINRPIRVEGREHRVTCVGMGNPHCVVFHDDLKGLKIDKIGSLLETHHLFPQKANVEFVRVLSTTAIEMRVWERGTGETMSCGSGACAAAVASILNGFTERKLEVKLAGGYLAIEWSRESGHVTMTGPAETVYSGEVEL